MDAAKVGELFFLLHPGQAQYSGYGITVEAGSVRRLVGLLMVDRPQPVSQTWLAQVERMYGSYELYRMTATGERGIACQMWVTEDSLAYVGPLAGTLPRMLQTTLFPLLLMRPKPHLLVSWDAQQGVWRSEFYQPPLAQASAVPSSVLPTPRFVLGHVVATPGALEAIEEAGQRPQHFLYRHMVGNWGELDAHDRQMNEQALRHGGRLLSAYTTRKGVRIWIITEADRSTTTILLPLEY